jgi:hypothetical protein
MSSSAVLILSAATDPPAGGAALGEVVGASALAGGMTAVLLLVGWAHRTRRTTVLARAADRCGRAVDQPGWVALPTLLGTASLLTALLGMYWDISLHIGQGRDEGPLANPAHYLILFGLFGVFAAGALAMVLPLDERPGPAAVRITRDWHAPVGGLLLCGAGLYALLGFPLDDVWHRLFGQDVTLWGPTHLMLIGGAGLSLVGTLVLEQEGRAARPADASSADTGRQRLGTVLRRSFALGGLLIGLSVFQGEFDFGVPQFRLMLQPMLIAAAAGTALVCARVFIGRGGALAAAGFFLVVRGTVSVIVGPVLGEPTPALPLYLGSALLVELLAFTFVRRPVLFGAVAGLAVGTLGSLSEAAWSRLVSPLPWGSDILVEAALLSAVAGLAGGLLGALLALGLRGQLPRARVVRPVFIASLLAIGAAVGNGLIATVPGDLRATVALQEAPSIEGVRQAQATVELDPAGRVEDPSWVQLTAWQGGGLVVERLEQTGPGTWRTTEPVPVSGAWRTLLRLHDGRMLSAVPVWLPSDAAIGAPEIPAADRFTRAAGAETLLLQRERNLDVPGWLWAVSCLVVLLCTLVLVVALAWGVARFSRRASRSAVARAPRFAEPVREPASR